MKNFDYKNTPGNLLKPDIVALLINIHEHKGKQDLFIEAHADTLTALTESAKIQSVSASNAIEGIKTTDKQLKALVQNKITPQTRPEQEIMGYRDVLATIHESYDYIPLTENHILQFHKQLYSFFGNYGGEYKTSDNKIAETDTNGETFIRFNPVPAYLTQPAMNDMISAFNSAIEEKKYDALLLIPMFILDFLSVHPFPDGNGRMSRLLTLLLLYRAGYIVGKYISLEKLIEDTKETYYETLKISSDKWHENENDYMPFVRYSLGILQKAYSEFEERVSYLSQKNFSKQDRIKAVIDSKIGKITKKEIMEKCPDISESMIKQTLSKFVKQKDIEKIGWGKSISYGKINKQ
ncbi:MAG: Fic family protein [Ruminococcus sp.]|jgi:Fic family protein|nr:Fic family protein [Ruminococcus sp.]